MKVLITGGMGVIGAEATRKFVLEGHRPVIYARRRDERLIADLLDRLDIELGDITDAVRLTEVLKKHAITHIEGATLIPLQQIQQHADKLRGRENDEVIVHCKSGGRSMQFVQILRQNGFKNAKSMAGGISLWNKDVNPGGPQY